MVIIQDEQKGDESYNQRRIAIQNVEKMQKQMEKYKDEVENLKKANETRDKRLMDLKEKLSNQESMVNKSQLKKKKIYIYIKNI